MRATLCTRAATAALVLFSAGCSLLVQPDDRRLTPGGDAATADVGPRADGAVDAPQLVDGDAPAPPPDEPTAPPDAPADVAPEVALDAPPDAPADVVVPLDAPPPFDARPDAAPDALPDAAPDARPDAPVDTGPMCPAVCTDGVACTVDRCDPSTGRCVFSPDDTRCAARQRCDAVMGCVPNECRTDPDCSDGNACTGVERCVTGACVPGTALRCDDGQFCNGAETCNPAAGCVPGAPPACTSPDRCNVGRCNSAASGGAGACEFTRVAACAPPNDTCAGAIAFTLPASGGEVSILGSTRNAANGVDSACGSSGADDVWYAVTYPSNHDLRVEVAPAPGAPSGADPIVVVREGCTSSDLVCNDDAARSGRGARAWLRAPTTASPSPTRTVRVVVDAFAPGAESDFVLRVASAPAVVATLCTAPGFDVTEGGTVRGSVSPGVGATRGSCGGGGGAGSGGAAPEDVYRYAGPAGPNVQFTLRPAAGAFVPTVYARAGACAAGPELRCATGSPAMIDFNQPAGTTYVFVDGLPAFTGAPYTLQVLRP